MAITKGNKINKMSQSKVSKQTKISSGVDKDTKNMVKQAVKEKEVLMAKEKKMKQKMAKY